MGVTISFFTLIVALVVMAKHPWSSPDVKAISVAVLPFHVLNPVTAQGLEDLRIALPSEIRTQLANLGMRLPAIQAALAYEDRALSAEQVGQQLSSDYVVEGTLHGTDSVGAEVGLIRVKDGTSLLGKHYDLPRSNLLFLQQDVVREVGRALRIPTTAIEKALTFRRHTGNPDAYQLYLNGRTLLVRHTEDGIRKSVQAFEAALKLDANYAEAYAGLAVASAEMPSRFAAKGELKAWTERAKDAARRALELNTNLPEAHAALAAIYRRSEYNWAGTVAESRRALDLDSNLDQPHYYMAGAFYHLGLLEMVEKEVTAGEQAAGGSAASLGDRAEAERNRGVAALLDGRFDDAVRHLEESRG
jgi:TolB-like protein